MHPISVYTKPVSSFAASFIGNYNQISQDDFLRMTRKQRQGETAIRPETFSISAEPLNNADEYQMEGVIVGNIPRGNVLRYEVDVNSVTLFVDVLFRSKVLFETGSRIYLSVAEHNCISL